MPIRAVRRLLIAALVAPASALGAGLLLSWLSEHILADRGVTLGLHSLLPTLGLVGRPVLAAMAVAGLLLAAALAWATRRWRHRAPGFATTAGNLLAGQAAFFVAQALIVGGSGAFLDDVPTLLAVGVLEVLAAAVVTALAWCFGLRIARFVADSLAAEPSAGHIAPQGAHRHPDPFCPAPGLLNRSRRRGPPPRLLLAR